MTFPFNNARSDGLRMLNRARDRPETEEVFSRPLTQPSGRLVPEPTVKARRVRWVFFESTTFISTGAILGESGDNSLEGKIERWRQSQVGKSIAAPVVPDVDLLRADEKEFLDWAYDFDGTTHRIIIRFME